MQSFACVLRSETEDAVNSHYVPRLILRKFAGGDERISVYNVKNGELKENVPIEKVYAEKGFYNDETEKKLNEKIESKFGSLLSNHILKCDKEVVLSREQLRLVKKFLLLSVLRSMGSETLVQEEKYFWERVGEQINAKRRSEGVLDEDSFQPPFQENQIEGEMPFDYWMRTLNVVLDTDGSPDEILKHPNKTYPAHRWSCIVNAAYLSFWDVPIGKDEFLITDIGMTSENEVGWNGQTVHNHKKLDYFIELYGKARSEAEQTVLSRHICNTVDFHENFQMFPISSKRMIVLIAPFFKHRYERLKQKGTAPSLCELTNLPNESLFAPNRCYYRLKQTYGQDVNPHPDDRYIYEVKTLKKNELLYCNALFLDRIDTHLGFSSLRSVTRSIRFYLRNPYVPRVDYRPLYKIIQKRYK